MLQRFDSSPSSLTLAQRAIHSYVLGQPGMGKSRLLESWVMQDIVAGRGLAVIDPHGDLFHNLLLRLVKLCQKIRIETRLWLVRGHELVYAR